MGLVGGISGKSESSPFGAKSEQGGNPKKNGGESVLRRKGTLPGLSQEGLEGKRKKEYHLVRHKKNEKMVKVACF